MQALCAVHKTILGSLNGGEDKGFMQRIEGVGASWQKSDRIPGVNGIGEKGAASILRSMDRLRMRLRQDPGRDVAPLSLDCDHGGAFAGVAGLETT